MVQASRRRAQPSGRRVPTREAPVRASKTSDAVRRGKKKSVSAALWAAFRQGFAGGGRRGKG